MFDDPAPELNAPEDGDMISRLRSDEVQMTGMPSCVDTALTVCSGNLMLDQRLGRIGLLFSESRRNADRFDVASRLPDHGPDDRP